MPVLVPQADALGMIGVIRSLGRAGFEVHAISPKKDALGFRSTYASYSAVCPPMEHAEFAEWLKSYCDQKNIEVLIPTESLMLAIYKRLADFESILPVSIESEKIETAYSKARMQQFFEENQLIDNTPPAFVVTQQNVTSLRHNLERLVFPVYVKTDAIDSTLETRKVSRVIPALHADDAIKATENLLKDFTHVLVQGNCKGQGAGVNCLRWEGQYPAVLTNFCNHETPHTGGLSTFRSTYSNPAMESDALRRLDALGWKGVAMVEYKVDRHSGEFSCIEINARFWAALHLCLFAGADFPHYLVASHKGIPFKIPEKWKSVSCCYDIPGEVAYVSSLFKDTDINVSQKIMALIGFFGMYLNPKLHFDLSFPGDRKLYFINLCRFLGIQI